MMMNATPDVAFNWALIIPVTRAKEIVGVRISPVEVVEEEEKLRVIQTLTSSVGRPTARKTRKGGEGAGSDSGNRLNGITFYFHV